LKLLTQYVYRRYSFKSKRPRIDEGEDEDVGVDEELAESVRTITALFTDESGTPLTSEVASQSGQTLESQVASISAELVAAIAQARSRREPDDSEIDPVLRSHDILTMNTSGIRGGRGSSDDDSDSDGRSAVP